MVEPFRKTIWQFCKILNIDLPHDSAIALLGIHERELKTYPHATTLTGMFIGAIFVTAKNWKPNVHQSMNG